MNDDYLPLSALDLPAAAAMVRRRYADLAQAHPTLVPVAPPADLPDRLDHLRRHGAGAVVGTGDHCRGFVGGYHFDHRGVPAVHVPDWAHGLDDASLSRYGLLYRAAAKVWLAAGAEQHSISFYATEQDALRQWTTLGFGQVVCDGLRDLAPRHLPPPDAEIVTAGIADLDDLRRLEDALWRHLEGPPSSIPFVHLWDAAAWKATLTDPRQAVWIARQNGQAVAFFKLEPPEHPVLPVDQPGTIACTGAYTQPAARGGGVATALFNQALIWARAKGYKRMSVDYETANLEAVGFWPRAGFQPVCISLLRRVDERLVAR